jgi:hypothetical protein
MSRVRDALRRANAMQPLAARIEAGPVQALMSWERDRIGPARLSTPPGPREHSAEPGSFVQATLSEARPGGDAPEEAGPEQLAPEEFSPAPEESNATLRPANSRGLASHPLLRKRWVRRMLRFAGVRMGGPVPTCRGLTRLGLPCRGPAMANGFCRLHGGSRSGIVAETTRSLLERISPAR